jgi:hypothetical protein
LSRILESDERAVREEIDDYELTIETIVATRYLVSHDLGGQSEVARWLKTSPKNAILPSGDVRPDLTIEIPKNSASPAYRAVNEIKANLPKDQTFWLDDARQLKKYDDDLENWDIPPPMVHDIIFTTNSYRTYDFDKYLKDLEAKGTLRFERKVSIVARTRESGTQTFISLKKEYGEISNPALDQLLAKRWGVNLEHILAETYKLKFYDAEPPTIYTMEIIWDIILKLFVPPDQFKQLTGRKTIPIEVTLDQLYKAICVYAPDSSNPCIKKEWVRKAMNGFISLGVANRRPGTEEKYHISMSIHRGKEKKDWIFRRISELTKNRKGQETLPTR